MVVSKRNIIDPKFYSFGDIKGAQTTVNKGFFVGKIQTENGQIPFAITHLDPSSDDGYTLMSDEEITLHLKSSEKYKEISFNEVKDEIEAQVKDIRDSINQEKAIRKEELTRIKDALEEIREPHENAYIFADFNIHKNGPEAKETFAELGFVYTGDGDEPTNNKEELEKEGLYFFSKKKEGQNLPNVDLDGDSEEQNPLLKKDLKPHLFNFDYALCLPGKIDGDVLKVEEYVSNVIRDPLCPLRATATSDHVVSSRTITASFLPMNISKDDVEVDVSIEERNEISQ